MDNDEILRAAAHAEAREALGGDHPPPERLLAYHEGELEEVERELLQEHLAACPVCARAVVDLTSFPHLEPAAGTALSDAEADAAWRRLRRAAASAIPEPERRAAAAGAPPAGADPPIAAPPIAVSPIALPARPARVRLAYALAASLLAATAGLGLWVMHLRGELARPRPNVFLGDLLPAGAAERATGEVQQLRVPAQAAAVLLLLNLGHAVPPAAHEAVLTTADGRRIWRSRELLPSADGTFTLELPRRFLPPGRYRLRLSTASGEGREPVVEYEFHLSYEEE